MKFEGWREVSHAGYFRPENVLHVEQMIYSHLMIYSFFRENLYGQVRVAGWELCDLHDL